LYTLRFATRVILLIACCAVYGDEKPPNILLILADDLGYGDLGCYGNTFCETPNLDQLAGGGMRFTQGYAPAPICSASRAAMLTGKSPARLGFEFVTKNEGDYAAGWADRYRDKKLIPPVYTLNLPLSEETIAEVLNPLGYATGLTGKWHVSAHYQGYLGWSPTHGPSAQGFAWSREGFGAHPYAFSKSERRQFGAFAPGEFPGDALTEGAIEFLREKGSEPFFLMVSHYYVHDPLATPCKWLLDKYERRAGEKYNNERALYGAFVATLDHYVGQLLDALEELGLADDTLVVFTSDNGGHPKYAFNGPLRGSKWNLYEGGIRVPFIVRWPGVVPAGSVCDVPVSGTDLLPTFQAIAGGPSAGSPTLDGRDLAPLLRGEEVSGSESRRFYWHFPYYHPERGYDESKASIGIEDGYVSQTRPHSAMRAGDYKLIYFWEDMRAELYDLEKDSSEQRDLAEEMPEIAAALEGELLGYLSEVEARLPVRVSP